MSNLKKIKMKGFTLVELMLVMVIIAFLAIFAVRMARIKTENSLVTRASLQMQQIFEAATSYYIDQYKVTSTSNAPTEGGSWPGTQGQMINPSKGYALFADGYLPTSMIINQYPTNPWGSFYSIGSTTGGKTFEIQTDVPNQAIAEKLANSLPIASVSADGNKYKVTAQINIPSYNYNNARAVNQLYYYQPGQCITMPTCPTGMSPVATLATTGILGFSDSTGLVSVSSFQTYLGPAAGGVSKCMASDMTQVNNAAGVAVNNPGCDVTKHRYQVCLRLGTPQDSDIVLTPTEQSKITLMGAIKCVPTKNGVAPAGGSPYDPPVPAPGQDAQY